MGFITYKQADSRWGKKNYNGSSTMATAGCGPTACAMIAYGIDGRTTPLDTMKYMQKNGFAIRNNGTAWSGIPSCLKAFGLKDVQNVPNMAKCWELMSKGYVGVFLFRSGSRGGVTWTTSGHYIAVTDYKVVNGKHYIYTRDSGGRNHTGWYCYETQMRGLIPQIWLGKIEQTEPAPEPAPEKKSYDGAFPDLVLHSRQIIGKTAQKLAYAKNTTKATYTYPKGKAKAIFTKALQSVYSAKDRATWSKQCRAGASCDVGAGTILRYSGYDTAIKRGLDEQIPHLKKSSLWQKTNIKECKDMAFGDVGVYSGHGGHIWISLGGKLLAEANHTAKYFEHIVSKNITKGNHTYFAVFRACKPTVIKNGSEGTEVTKLQNFLNWSGFSCGKADGGFGENTLKAVKSFQSAVGIEADGVVGEGTISKMKEYKK